LPSPELVQESNSDAVATAFVQLRAKKANSYEKFYGKAAVFTQTQSTALMRMSASKFDKLKKMVSKMVNTMVVDQKEDDKQLAWCKMETETVENQLSSVKDEVKTYKQKLEETKNEVAVA